MPVDGGVKVAPGVDLVHQLAHYGGAGLSLIAGVGGQHRFSVLIEAGEGHHIARLVIVHLDLRVDAEQHGAHAAAVPALEGGTGGGPGGGCRCSAVPTGGQSGQGQGGHQGQSKQLGGEVRFHNIHLLKNVRSV